MHDVSVIICTRNRADSLRATLNALAVADRREVTVEVVVVDNGSTDSTPSVAAEFGSVLAVRYLVEAFSGEYGKGPGLNRALDAGGLGHIVAVLDDDMSVAQNWFRAVVESCAKHPGFDFFTGPSAIDRPFDQLPGWLRDRRLIGWQLSVVNHGRKEMPLRDGGSFSGNHFWFRSKAIDGAVRFSAEWNPEPAFFNLLRGKGCRGIYVPDASVVHRIQDHLLTLEFAQRRARMVGVSAARMRLIPYRGVIRIARFLHEHPALGRWFLLAKLGRWRADGLIGLIEAPDRAIERRLIAIQFISYYREMLRICRHRRSYWIFARELDADDVPEVQPVGSAQPAADRRNQHG